MKADILIVDDDSAHRSMLVTMLGSWGYNVFEAEDGDIAISMVKEQAFDVVLMDVRMARISGIDALQEIIKYNPMLPVILMTAYSSLENAISALRIGAYDYLLKPFDFDDLKRRLNLAIEHSRLCIENKELRRQLSNVNEEADILGNSLKMQELINIIKTVAQSNATVLISGESGTGKELVARSLHRQSTRNDMPFVAINCAALSENLLESELFGHEKGAFTGADKKRDGRFVQANNGTIFLDEIGEIPLTVQAKLLRVLQEGEIQRLGSDLTLKVDVRVIAATNRNLEKEVFEKRFREDLYFRLNVITIDVPPLRERLEDIPLLASYFLTKFVKKNNKIIKGFEPRTLDKLLRYNWPGNVRELENAIERSVILCQDELISESVLPRNVLGKNEEVSFNFPNALGEISLDNVEKIAIEATLSKTDNKSEVARILGITRSTLLSKMKKYGLDKE